MPRRDVSPAASAEAPRGPRASPRNALSGSCTGTAVQSSPTKPKRRLPLIEWPCASAQPLHAVPIESPWTTRAGQGILKTTNERGSNSAGRVPASQAGCRGFESRLPLRVRGRSQDRPLRASDLSAASCLRSASPHRLAPRGRDPPDPTPPPVALFQHRCDARFSGGKSHPAGSLGAPTLMRREGRGRREPFSCGFLATFSLSTDRVRRATPSSAESGRLRPDRHASRRAPLPAPSREDQKHSRNSDEIRSSHRIERPQKRVPVVARPLQMIERIDGQGVQCAAGFA
jgi:hypothetical protein